MHSVTINGEQYVPEKPYNRILDVQQWLALENAENALYKNVHGGNGYTHVMDRESSWLVAACWDNCTDHMDQTQDDPPTNGQIAARVARVFMMMAFGPESLLR